jgi:hypothetical protein
MKSGQRVRALLVVSLVAASCSPMRACAEANLELEPDSRLPAWFSLPPGRTRNEVTAKLTDYVGLHGLITVFDLVDRDGRIVSTLTGRPCEHPASPDYPNHAKDLDYTYVTISGITEVIAHRPVTSVLRVSDDPELIRQAKDLVAQGKCAQSGE